MLGVQEEDGSFSAHTLSNDHSAQNEEEVARIRSEHPPSERKTVIRQVIHLLICSKWLLSQHLLKPLPLFLWSSFIQDRLLGLLMPLRAFGDVKFKWSIDLQKCVLESGPDQLHENEHTKFIPPNYHTPPYLTAEPEITYHKLRPQDRFMVREGKSSLYLFPKYSDAFSVNQLLTTCTAVLISFKFSGKLFSQTWGMKSHEWVQHQTSFNH